MSDTEMWEKAAHYWKANYNDLADENDQLKAELEKWKKESIRATGRLADICSEKELEIQNLKAELEELKAAERTHAGVNRVRAKKLQTKLTTAEEALRFTKKTLCDCECCALVEPHVDAALKDIKGEG